MASTISVSKSKSTNKFDKLPKRLYQSNNPPLKRVFSTPEIWCIESGDVEFTDDLTQKSMIATTGEVIVLPANSAFSNMKFNVDTYIKQYIDDIDERNRISTNVKINYLIIKTILEISDIYYVFNSIPFDISTDFIFDSAEKGNLYNETDNWLIVDMVIQNFVDRTGISENVWYGKRRIMTGLKYNKPEWDSSLSIDYNEDISSGTMQRQKEAYALIKNDPLDIKSQKDLHIDESIQSLFTLENLLTFVARAIREEEKTLLKNVFPSDIKLRLPRNSGEYLNNKTMLPKYLLYGNELSTVIKHLFWTTSVGFENRLKLI